MCQQIWKLSSGHRTGKGQFSFQSQRRVMPKNVQTTIHLCSCHMLARLCSKSFKLGFNSMWTENFQVYKLDLEKAEEPEIKLSTLIGSWRKQGNSRNTFTSALLTMLKPLTLWITAKSLKGWEYQTSLPVSWENCMWIKKQQLEMDTEQWIGSKLGKEYNKVVYCHPAYLTYMQSTSCEMLGGMNRKLELRLQGDVINNLRYTDNTTLMEEIEEELKSLLKRVKEESEKSDLKRNFKNKLRSWHLVPSLYGKQKGKKRKQWQLLFSLINFIFLGSKITIDGDCSHEIKRNMLPGRKAMRNPVHGQAPNFVQLCDFMDFNLPFSSVQGILQARILEWVAISSSRGSSWPRDRTCTSCSPFIGRCILPLSHPGNQHIKKQRHHFANKGPYSQSYFFFQ